MKSDTLRRLFLIFAWQQTASALPPKPHNSPGKPPSNSSTASRDWERGNAIKGDVYVDFPGFGVKARQTVKNFYICLQC